MLNNADPTIKDKDQRTVITIIDEKLARLTPNHSQALHADYEHMRGYLNNLSKQEKYEVALENSNLLRTIKC